MDRPDLSQLLDLVLDRVSKARTLDTELYHLLVTLFPTVLAPALEILDNGRITKLVCYQSKRHFYKVKEQQQTSRKSDLDGDTFDVVNDYCFCYFYARECLSPSETGSAALCKHILAVKLAEALSNSDSSIVIVKEIEDRDYAPLLLQSRAYISKYEDNKQSNVVKAATHLNT